MKNLIPRFKRPIQGIDEPSTNIRHWNKAKNAYEKFNYRTSILETLNYMNPEILQGKDLTKDISIVRGQGSAEIQIDITDDFFSVKAPFLKVTDRTNRIPLYRKITEINRNNLALARIRLKKDTLWFEYETPITSCEPLKVYDVLHEICLNACDYNDEFVDNFKADFYLKANVQELTGREEKQVWQQIDGILEDYKIYASLLMDRSLNNFQWDIITISLLRIINMPYVHGTLHLQLTEQIQYHFNAQLSFANRVEKGDQFLKQLRQKTRDDIMKDVYHSDTIISLKKRTSVAIIQKAAKDWEHVVDHHLSKGDNFSLCYFLQYNFLYLLHKYNLDAQYKNIIYGVFESVVDCDATETTLELLKAYYSLLDGNTKELYKANRRRLLR